MDAELIVHNGRVFRSGRPGSQMDAGATAVAIGAGRIVAVGDERQAREWAGPTTKLFDAGGGLVMPGFDDAHMHLRDGAISLERLDLFGMTTLDVVQAAIADYAADAAGAAVDRRSRLALRRVPGWHANARAARRRGAGPARLLRVLRRTLRLGELARAGRGGDLV